MRSIEEGVVRLIAERKAATNAGLVSTEPKSELDLDAEAERLTLWSGNNGITYRQNTSLPLDFISGIDRGEEVFAVAYMTPTTWPNYRPFTLNEMANFLRVVRHALPDHPQTKVLEERISARINSQLRVLNEVVSSLQLNVGSPKK